MQTQDFTKCGAEPSRHILPLRIQRSLDGGASRAGSRRDVLHLRFSECLLAEVLAQRAAGVQIHLTPENAAQFGFYREEVKPRSEPRLKFNEGIDVTRGGEIVAKDGPKNASL